jgi:hypothetical protein
MRFSSVAPLVLLSISAAAVAQNAQTLKPPVANKIHTEKHINGAVLTDDYAWLRDRASQKVHAYLEAENAYAEASTASQKPLADKLYNETLSHIKQTDVSVPYRQHGYWYYTRTQEGKQYPVLCRKKETLSAPEEVMLDVNELAKGEKFMGLGEHEVSDDSNLLAYTTDNVGFRQYRLHVKDLRTGKVLADSAERVDSLVWAADNKTIFYTTEDAQTKRSDLLHRHTVGTSSAADPVVYNEKDERYELGVGRTRDEKYILLDAESHITSEWRFLEADKPTGAWKMMEPRHEGVRYSVDEERALLSAGERHQPELSPRDCACSRSGQTALDGADGCAQRCAARRCGYIQRFLRGHRAGEGAACAAGVCWSQFAAQHDRRAGTSLPAEPCGECGFRHGRIPLRVSVADYTKLDICLQREEPYLDVAEAAGGAGRL